MFYFPPVMAGHELNPNRDVKRTGNTEHVHPCVTKKTASSLTCVLQLQCIFSMATPPEQVSTV